MNIKKFSKADLIWIIQRIQVDLSGTRAVDLAILDLQYEKEMQSLDEIDKQMDISCGARKKYIELMTPYNGKSLANVPAHVLKAAGEVLKVAETADKKMQKIMKSLEASNDKICN